MTTTLAPLPDFVRDAQLDGAARVWTYIAHRPLSPAEQDTVRAALAAFTQDWTSHNQALYAKGELFAERVVLLVVDETRSAHVGGCSIDTSVRFLRHLGEQLGVDWFDRMIFGWQDADGQYQFAPRAEFARLVNTTQIGPDTLVINTLADTKRAVQAEWLVPFRQSWHQRLL